MAGLLALGIGGPCCRRSARGRAVGGWRPLTGANGVPPTTRFGATLPLIVLLYQWRDGMAVAQALRRYLSTAAWLARRTFARRFTINGRDSPTRPMHLLLAVVAPRCTTSSGPTRTSTRICPTSRSKAEPRGHRSADAGTTSTTRWRIVYIQPTRGNPPPPPPPPPLSYPIINDAKHTMWKRADQRLRARTRSAARTRSRTRGGTWSRPIRWAYVKHRLKRVR